MSHRHSSLRPHAGQGAPVSGQMLVRCVLLFRWKAIMDFVTRLLFLAGCTLRSSALAAALVFTVWLGFDAHALSAAQKTTVPAQADALYSHRMHARQLGDISAGET